MKRIKKVFGTCLSTLLILSMVLGNALPVIAAGSNTGSNSDTYTVEFGVWPSKDANNFNYGDYPESMEVISTQEVDKGNRATNIDTSTIPAVKTSGGTPVYFAGWWVYEKNSWGEWELRNDYQHVSDVSKVDIRRDTRFCARYKTEKDIRKVRFYVLTDANNVDYTYFNDNPEKYVNNKQGEQVGKTQWYGNGCTIMDIPAYSNGELDIRVKANVLYKVDYWVVKENGKFKKIDFDTFKVPLNTEYTNIYAHYVKDTTVQRQTVTYEDASGVIATESILWDASPKIPAECEAVTSKALFRGWAIKDNTTKKVYSNAEVKKLKLREDTTFVAQFDDASVTFDYWTGEYASGTPNATVTKTVDSKDKIAESDIPLPEDKLADEYETMYKFKGWKLKDSTDDTTYKASEIAAMTFTDNTTFEAVYEQMVMVNFNYTIGQTGKTHVGWGVKGEKLDETQWPTETPAPVDPEGLSLQTFKSWVYFGFGENGMFNADFTKDTILTNDSYNLIATYNVQHRVRFFEKDGTTQIGEDIYIDQYARITNPPTAKNPIDNGKEILYFKGWKVGDTTYEDISKYSTDGKDSGITYATDFVADYTTTSKYTVEFKYAEDLNNGAQIGDTQYVIPGEKLAETQLPTGYQETIQQDYKILKFTGWKKDGKGDPISTADLVKEKIDGNTTFVASYETKVAHSVRFCEFKFQPNSITLQETSVVYDPFYVAEGDTIGSAEGKVPDKPRMSVQEGNNPSGGRTKQVFIGWKVNNLGPLLSADDIKASTMGESDIWYYAQYKTYHQVIIKEGSPFGTGNFKVDWIEDRQDFDYKGEYTSEGPLSIGSGDEAVLYDHIGWEHNGIIEDKAEFSIKSVVTPITLTKVYGHEIKVRFQYVLNGERIEKYSDWIPQGGKLGADKLPNVIDKTQIPTKEGGNGYRYVFKNWKYSVENTETEFTGTEELHTTGDDYIINVIPDFKKEFRVTFQYPLNGETKTEECWVEDGKNLTSEQIPTGYEETRQQDYKILTFEGWKKNGEGDPISTENLTKEDIEDVTAFVASYKSTDMPEITFDYEDNGLTENVVLHLMPGDFITAPTTVPADYTDDDGLHSFDYWKNKDTGEALTSETKAEKDTTYVPVYKLKTAKHTVEFQVWDKDGISVNVSPKSVRVLEGSAIGEGNVPADPSTQYFNDSNSRRTFLGWKAVGSNETISGAAVAEVTVGTSEITYVAQFKTEHKVTFTDGAPFGNDVLKEVWVENDKFIKDMPDFSVNGLDLEGWRSLGEEETEVHYLHAGWNKAGETKSLSVLLDDMITEPMTISRVYEHGIKVVFQYVLNGERIEEIGGWVSRGDSLGANLLPNVVDKTHIPTKEGGEGFRYVFKNWIYSVDNTEKLFDGTQKLYPNENATSEDEKYTVVVTPDFYKEFEVTFTYPTATYDGQKTTVTEYVKDGEKLDVSKVPTLQDYIFDTAGNKYAANDWILGEATYTAAGIADNTVKAPVAYEANYERMVHLIFTYPVNGVNTTEERWIPQNSKLPQSQWPTAAPDKYYEAVGEDNTAIEKTFEYWIGFEGIYATVTPETTFTGETVHIQSHYETAYKVEFFERDETTPLGKAAYIVQNAKVENVPKAPTPIEEDEATYYHKGWKVDGNSIDISTYEIGAPTRFIADYDMVAKHAVTFSKWTDKYNGQKTTKTVYVKPKEKVQSSDIPSLPEEIEDADGNHYSLKGWKAGEKTYTAAQIADEEVTAEVTYEAEYERMVKVAFEVMDADKNEYVPYPNFEVKWVKQNDTLPKTEWPADAPKVYTASLGRTYTFRHWTVNKNAVLTEETKFTGEEAMILAQYDAAWDVSFFKKDGTTAIGETQVIADLAKVTDVPTAEEEVVEENVHYNFVGWKSSLDNQVYTADQIKELEVREAVTYTAEYQRMVKVTFGVMDADKNEYVPYPNVEVKWVKQNDTLPKTEWPADAPKVYTASLGRTYTFRHWTVNKNAVLTEETKLTGEEAMILAQYDAAWDVSFFKKDGTTAIGETQVIADLAKVTDVPTADEEVVENDIHYNFIGWKSSLDNQVYTADQIKELEVREAVTYTAEYQRMVKVSFEYEFNGAAFGTVDWIIKGEKYPESKWPKETPTKKDTETQEFRFEYWIYDVNGTNTKFTEEVEINNDTVVRPSFSTHDKPVVTFKNGDGSVIENATQYVLTGGYVTSVPEATKESTTTIKFNYKGWKVEGSNDNSVYTADEVKTYQINTNVVFVSEFEEEARPLIKFTDRGNTVKSENIDKGTSIEAPSDPATWEDNNGKYDFKEWKSADGTVYSASLTFDSDTEFFAEYTTTNKYGVTFKDLDGNDFGEVQYILDGQPAKAPENPPVKPEDENGAYTFVGWHKEVIEPTPEQTRNFRRAALIMPTESYLTTDEVNVEPVNGITIYTPVYATTAKFDVKFMNYDGVTQIGETIRALDGTTVTPPTATRENTPTTEYTFAGWRIDGQGDVLTSETVSGMLIEGDTTFVAVFNETEVLGEEFENPDDEEVLGEEFTNTNDESEVLGADFTATGDTAPLFIMIVSLMMSVIVIAGMSKRRKDI